MSIVMSHGRAGNVSPDAMLFLGDCREIVDDIGPRIDAIVTDPPYGIGYVQGGGRRKYPPRFAGVKIIGDDEPFDPRPFLDLAPLSVWFGANHYADRLPTSPCWFVWDKREAPSTLLFSDCELAWVSRRGPARIFRHLWNGMMKRSERGEPRVHPTQKPVALMRWVLDQIGVPEGGIVLDPFMGSGSTGVACAETGRRFIGIEMDPVFFQTACDRIDHALGQPRLFPGQPSPATQVSFLDDGV